MLKVDVASGRSQTLLTETSPNWIELHNDLHFLEHRPAFMWSSRRSGYKHLYLYDLDGKLHAARSRPASGWSWAMVSRAAWSASTRSGHCVLPGERASPLERQLYVNSLDTGHAGRSDAGLARMRAGTTRSCCRARAVTSISYSSPEQPPTASLRKLDGWTAAALARAQRARRNASVSRVPADHVKEEFGSIAARGRPAAVLSPAQAGGAAAGQALPRHRRCLRRSAQPVRRRRTGWAARGRAGYFRQVLAQHGFVVFTLDNRGSGFRGNAFETALAQRFGKVEIADQLRGVEFLKTLDVRRSAAHRHHGLELRRLHDADGAHDDRRIQGGRGRRARHRLAALRHALH